MMKLAKETWIIAAIGVADLVTTIIFIRHHGAQEANPVFRHYWDMGLFAFVAAKCTCLAGPLFILEWARRRRPRFVSWALRAAIMGYVGMYGIGFVRLNGPANAHFEEADASEVTQTGSRHYIPPITFSNFRSPAFLRWQAMAYDNMMARFGRRIPHRAPRLPLSLVRLSPVPNIALFRPNPFTAGWNNRK